MDTYLEIVLTWLRGLNINPNLDKLKRQLSIINSWFKNNGIGILEAVTGFGKTMVALIIIYRMLRKNSNSQTIVVVPKLELQAIWRKLVSNFNLSNVSVYVVNSYISAYLQHRNKWKCDLLVADEIHNYASEDAEKFSLVLEATDYKYMLGLTATLDEDERKFLSLANVPVIDTVTIHEARVHKYISNFIVYNLGIELDSVERERYSKLNDIHNSNFGKFRYFANPEKNWQLARACSSGNFNNVKVGDEYKTASEWKTWYAETMGWDGTPEHEWSPKNINKYANQWSWAMRERKKFLHSHDLKINTTVSVINYLNKKTITFAETTDFVDKLVTKLGKKALAYHSNLDSTVRLVPTSVIRKQPTAAKNFKKKVGGTIAKIENGWEITYNKEVKVSKKERRNSAIQAFIDNIISVLCSAKAIDEGIDIPDVEVAIICSGSSKKRQNTQRVGRAVRFVEDKVAIIVNLYFKETQDEIWLKSRQKGDPGIMWIDDISNIKI